MLVKLLLIVSSLLILTQGQVTYTVNEPGSINISLAFNSSDLIGTETITVEIAADSVAINGTDFFIPSSISIAENDTSPLLVPFTVFNDTVIETNETVSISFSSELFNTENVTVVIISTDTLDVSVQNTATTSEGQTLELCANTSTSNYGFSFTVTANAPSNYVTMTQQMVQFNLPAVTNCVSFMITSDSMLQEERTFNVTWSASETIILLSPTTTTVTIPSEFMLYVANSAMTITESDGSVSVCIMANGEVGPSPVTVNYTIVSGTATLKNDFTVVPPSGTLTIPSGQRSSCVSIAITDDDYIERSESFDIMFSSPNGAMLIPHSTTTTVTILDNDSGTISFVKQRYVVSENISQFQPMLNRTGMYSANFYIMIGEQNLTPQIGEFASDYTSVLWSASTPSSPLIFVNITNNNIVELNRTFTLTVLPVQMGFDIRSSPNNYSEVTIINDDTATISVPPSTTINKTDNSVTICATSDNTISESYRIYNISYTTIDGTAEAGKDYMSVNSTLDLPLNTSARSCITISIMADDGSASEETFTVRWSLNGPPPQVTLERTDTTVTIVNNIVPTTTLVSTSTMVVSTSTMVVTSTMVSTSASSVSPSVSATPPPAFPLSTVAIVGIIVGVVVLGLLLLLILLCIIIFVKVKSNRQGFYTTYEDKEETPQMLRYSASLRSLQSQTVMPADPRDKENEYMI